MLSQLTVNLEGIILILSFLLVLFHLAEARAIYMRRIRGRKDTGLFPALLYRGLASSVVFGELFVLYFRQVADYPPNEFSGFLIRLQWVLILIVAVLAKIKFITAMRQG